MSTKAVQRLKAQLASNPLHYVANSTAVCCTSCGGVGKRVPLYAVTNYGNEFNTCYLCKTVYR